jgi:hypothetical protein
LKILRIIKISGCTLTCYPPQGIAEKTASTGSFIKHKMREYEQLKQEIESLTQKAGLLKAVEAAEVGLETSQDTLNVKAEGSVNG